MGKYFDGLVDLCNWAAPITKGLNAVEVGSYIGESAEVISAFYKMLWCIDPWGNELQGKPGVLAKDIFLKRFPGAFNQSGCLRDCGCTVVAIEKSSPKAASMFVGENIGLVYIDGNHGYLEVKNDILAWLQIIQKGVIAGHDYDPVLQPGVVQAVNEIFGKPPLLFQDTSWAFVM